MNPHLSPYSNMELRPHLFHLSFLYSSTFSWLRYLKENSRHIIPDIWAFSDVTTSLSQATNEHLEFRVVMLCPDPVLWGGLVVPAAVRAAGRQPRAAPVGITSAARRHSPKVCGLPLGGLQPTTDPCPELRSGPAGPTRHSSQGQPSSRTRSTAEAAFWGTQLGTAVPPIVATMSLRAGLLKSDPDTFYTCSRLLSGFKSFSCCRVSAGPYSGCVRLFPLPRVLLQAGVGSRSSEEEYTVPPNCP